MNPRPCKNPACADCSRLRARKRCKSSRDPSTLLVAFVLPVVMLFLFAYAVSRHAQRAHRRCSGIRCRAGPLAGGGFLWKPLLCGDAGPRPAPGRSRPHRRIAYAATSSSRRISQAGCSARTPAVCVQIITDGAQPNTATFVANYARRRRQLECLLRSPGDRSATAVLVQPPKWKSRRALVPGALAIIMTIIGTLLTALVIAREWERGTMEGLFSTPATPLEILAGKLLPYFALGLLATAISAALAVWVFGVPLRGSVFALLLISSAFLIPALGQVC